MGRLLLAAACSSSILGVAIAQGFAAPLSHVRSAEGRSLLSTTNTLDGLDSNNVLFQVAMSIELGTPTQTLALMTVDTGSSPLWVPSSTCSLNGQANACGSTSASSAFNPSASSTYSTYSAASSQFTASYGDGTAVSGPYVQDTLTINTLALPSYIFGLISTKTVPNGVGSSTGILGLAPSEDPYATSLIGALSLNSQVTTKQISFYFPPSLTDNTDGEIYIGGANTNHYTGTPTWVPTSMSNYWNVASNTIYVVSSTGTQSSSGSTGIIDTGTSLLVGPTSEIQAICSYIGLSYDSSSQGCSPICCASSASQCSSYPHYSTLKSFSLGFGNGITLPVNLADSFFYPQDSSNTNCLLPVQASDGGSGPAWIVGAAFIRQYYTIFDFTGYSASSGSGTGKVGFATKTVSNGGGATSTTTSTATTKTTTSTKASSGGGGGSTTTTKSTKSSSTTTTTTSLRSGPGASCASTSILDYGDGQGNSCCGAGKTAKLSSAGIVSCCSGSKCATQASCAGVLDCNSNCITQSSVTAYGSGADNMCYTTPALDCAAFNYENGACTSTLSSNAQTVNSLPPLTVDSDNSAGDNSGSSSVIIYAAVGAAVAVALVAVAIFVVIRRRASQLHGQNTPALSMANPVVRKPVLASAGVQLRSPVNANVPSSGVKLAGTTYTGLPAGWTEEVDPTTHQKYFFHAGKNLSQWDRPKF